MEKEIKYGPGLLVDVCHVLVFTLLQPGRLGNPLKKPLYRWSKC
jgi:hypothetical protein